MELFGEEGQTEDFWIIMKTEEASERMTPRGTGINKMSGSRIEKGEEEESGCKKEVTSDEV